MSGPALNFGPTPLDLLLFGSLQCRDGVSGKLDLDVLCYSELNPVVFESHYRTVNPTRSDDLIASLQIVDHRLKLLSLALCRQENEQVKDADNDEKKDGRSERWWRLLLLKKHLLSPQSPALCEDFVEVMKFDSLSDSVDRVKVEVQVMYGI